MCLFSIIFQTAYAVGVTRQVTQHTVLTHVLKILVLYFILTVDCKKIQKLLIDRKFITTVLLYMSLGNAHTSFTFFFFFQAEDGIRDYKVTGVQTCALPI